MKFKKYSTATDTYTTLPATFQTSGADVENYQVYGASSGVGEETENLWNPDAKDTSNGYMNGYYLRNDNRTESANTWCVSEYIEVAPNTQYTLKWTTAESPSATLPSICQYDANKDFISNSGTSYDANNTVTITTTATTKYIRFSGVISRWNVEAIRFNLGSTVIDVPPGYKIPILNTSGVTENLVPEISTANGWRPGYIDSNGSYKPNNTNGEWLSPYIDINVTTVLPITIKYKPVSSSASLSLYFFDANGDYISKKSSTVNGNVVFTSEIPTNAIKMCYAFRTYCITEQDLIQAEMWTSFYAPYRYEQNYDLFLGDSKLGEDEYLDYGEQKVYKRTANISKGTETGSIWSNSSSVPADRRGTDADANDRIRTKSGEYYKFSTTQSYTISTPGITGTQVSVYTYDPDDYTSLADSAWTNLPYTFTPSNYNYRFVIRYSDNRTINNSNYPNLMITEGSTAPESYDPYLQPTDPPVPLPTLSTYIGENSIDVDTTVQPEKVVLTVAAWREIEAKKYANGEWTDIVVRRYENGAWVPSPIPENNIADLQGLLTLLEDHWLPGENDYRSMILVRTNRNDDTANQLCYMLTCYSTNPSPHFASEFLNNRYWLNDFAVPYIGTNFYLRKFSWSQGGGWVYDGYEDNKRDDYFVPIDSNTYNVYLLRLGSSTQYDNNAGYQYFYDLSAYF